MTTAAAQNETWVSVDDYQCPSGWAGGPSSEERTRWCCQQLEDGQILFFQGIPYDMPEADREFLLSQKQSESGLHKNISYRPQQDVLRGLAAGRTEDAKRLHGIMRNYSAAVTQFLKHVLTPYAGHWSLDFASFRPEEEAGRDLALHKRNDLLHVDAFPTRPTHGGRILRVFTNINPVQPRIWIVTDRFPVLAQKYAADADLPRFAAGPLRSGGGPLAGLKKMIGMKAPNHSRYDRFMLRFHDYLKENSDFQQNCPKTRIEFPPLSTWMVYTDSVPHAVLSGQYALEQTFIIPAQAMLTPDKSPLAILEKMAGQKMANGRGQ